MSSHGKRILVADDDDAARDMLSALLVQAGYNVHATRNGREAVAEMQRKHFDLVITDCEMPHLDGRELLSYSRAAWPDTPVIMLSGGPVASAEEVNRIGAYAWVEKPYDTWFLLEIIRDALPAAAKMRSPMMTAQAKGA
ncbi:MAG: response regulator [Nitrospira sp.]|nr:response regulator [Nitrospira sp.]